ncbi:MAG: hypothetical protein QM767_16210 [Anaeromyxobacter sp.]
MHALRLQRVLAALAALALAACAKPPPPTTGPSTPVVTLPAQVSATVGGYTASVAAQGNATYAWSMTGGTITAGQGTTSVVFTAGTGSSVTASCAVTLGGKTATGSASASVCALACSADHLAVAGCGGAVIDTCDAGQRCDDGTASCADIVPVTPVITMPDAVSPTLAYTASVPPQTGVSYAWTITGGVITAGQDTASVSFLAGHSGTVELSVTGTAGPRQATGTASAGICPLSCSADGRATVGCGGTEVVEACSSGDACSPATVTCEAGCDAAAAANTSVGCDFSPVAMETYLANACLGVTVVNTWSAPVHLTVTDQAGAVVDAAPFTRVPAGVGTGMTLASYDPSSGLAPGQAAVVFLAGNDASGASACPAGIVTTKPTGAQVAGSGVGRAFRIRTDAPVAAYQTAPWILGGSITGATILLPAHAWGTNHMAATAGPKTVSNGALDIVAGTDATHVQVVPTAAIAAGGTVPATAAGATLAVTLSAGQLLQLSSTGDLSGSVITSDQPVSLLAGSPCAQIPSATSYCQHLEVAIPRVQALGSTYAAAMYRPRADNDRAYYFLTATANNTTLTYTPSAPAGAPTSIHAGQHATFSSATPFVVQSQDQDHAFILLQAMSGALATGAPGSGDPALALVAPTRQYLRDVRFQIDPNFPEANLVVVRSRGGDGQFADVELDCAGALSGWTALGTDHEWTRVDLLTGDFQAVGSCGAGPHEAYSTAPFNITVWGWGTAETIAFTENGAYAYPAGYGLSSP